MTASQRCPHCGNTVKPALTRNRRRRHVENDQYADFLRRALQRLHPPHRARATSTPSPASARWSPKRASSSPRPSSCLRAARLLLDRHRRSGSAPPARPPSNAGAPRHDSKRRGRRHRPRTRTRLGAGGNSRRRDHLRRPQDRERQLASTGTCSHPVRLHGRITAIDLATGEAAPVYDTSSEPGGVLHVACGNRRESRCPACSAVYKRDARQLVRAGLTGGKGVPESVAAHPCVFATLHRPVVRPGARPPDARQDRAALPPPPRRRQAGLPARPRHLLPGPPRRA